MTTEETRSDRPTATSSGPRRGVAIGVAGGLLAGTAAGLVFGVPGLTSATSSEVTPAAVVQQVGEDAATSPSDASRRAGNPPP
jgi:hypothetical protein